MDAHPFIVHFPIALLTVSAICDLVALLTERDQYARTGYLLLILGTIGAMAAALSGEAAEGVAEQIPGIHDVLENHENLATLAVWVAVILTLGRTHLVLKKRFAGAARVVYLALALGLGGLVLWVGFTGGRMVYEYEAGTRSAMERLERQESGVRIQEPE